MADSDMNGATSGNSDLQRLSDTHDFDVAEGYPDIRGWEVKTPDGQTIGKVDDLIVSVSEMRVRYVDVDVDRSAGDAVENAAQTAGADEGHVLIPIGSVELDDENDDVLANGLGDLSAYPRYSGGEISRDYETALRNRFGAGSAATTAQLGSSDFYEHEHFDDQRAYAKRRPTRERQDTDDTQTLTLAEEQLNVGKRRVEAGEVDVRKTVETEHVQEQVPLVREEVSVERRPLSGADAANVTIGDDAEIRIPVMREEAVVSKRAVAREEIIIRKQPRTEMHNVEADVRRERLDVAGDQNLTRNVRDSVDRPAQ